METSTKKQRIFFLFGMAFMCLTFILFIIYSNSKADEINYNYSFSGRVDSVSYDVKGIPYVHVNGQFYYLDDGYNFDHLVEKGDTMIKHKGSVVYKLIKHANKKVFKFKN